MRRRYPNLTLPGALAIAAALIFICAVSARAQSSPSATKPKDAPADKRWVQPRTPDGQPDIQGIWNTATLTPLERPAELGDEQFFTPEEALAYEKKQKEAQNRDRRDGGEDADLSRAYNEAWFDRGTKVAENLRTSLIIDPPDGRVPPMTPEAQKRFDMAHAWLAEHPADGPEDMPLHVRCLMFSQVGPPMLPSAYNNNYQILQTRNYVSILSEMGTVARIVPLDGRPHLPKGVTQWVGDSRGHWEGNTLVVDTTNFKSNGQNRFGVVYEGLSDENFHVIERFTRTSADRIIYRATVEDPAVYTKPWTIEVVMGKTSQPIFEYACHEGNYAMSDILAGARAEEKKSAGRGISK